MSHSSVTDDTTQSTMKTSNPTTSAQNAVPSTSKEPDNTQETSNNTNTLPHIITLPSSPQSNNKMKILQLSPIKSLPKGKINLIKLDAPPLLLNYRIMKPPTKNRSPFLQSHENVQQIIHKSTHSPSTTQTSQMIPITAIQSTSKSVPSANTTSSTVSKNSPTKKHQPIILQKKTATPNKASEANSTNIQEKETETNMKNAKGNKNKHTSSVMVRDIIRKAKYQRYNEKRREKRRQANQTTKTKEKQSRRNHKDSAKHETVNKDSSVTEENLYVADGFRADVEILLEKCSQVYKLNYETFTDIWKEMNFARVFHGRQSGAELAEFSEEAIHIAKSYMVASNVSLEENIGGLFLVYALLNLQPYPGFAVLRLTAADVPAVLRVQREARRQRRHDVLYVLASVLVRGPTHYHVLPREVALETPIRKYHDGTVQVSEMMESVFSRNAECAMQLKELVALEQRYHAMRQRLSDAHAGNDKIRKLCTHPAAALLEMYRAHIPRGIHSDGGDVQKLLGSPTKASDDRIDLVKAIKDKAMTITVDSMRHLTGVQERVQDVSCSSSDSEVVSSPTRLFKPKGKGRSTAQTLQELFFTADTKTDDISVPSRNEMPTLGGFGELGADLESNNDKKSNAKAQAAKTDDSNNNNRVAKLLNKTKSNAKCTYKEVPRKLGNRKNQIVDSDSDIDFIEVVDLEETDKTQKVATQKNNRKRKHEKGGNRSESRLDTSSSQELKFDDKVTKELQSKGAESKEIKELSRDEEISYLRSIIEEIEGSIEQDPEMLESDQNDVRIPNDKSQNIPNNKRIDTVNCEFTDRAKRIKRSKKEKADNKIDERDDIKKSTNKKKDNISNEESKMKERKIEIEIIPNDTLTPNSTSLKSPKARSRKSDIRHSPLTSPKSVASSEGTDSTRSRRESRLIGEQSVTKSPRITEARSPKKGDTRPEEEILIQPQEQYKRVNKRIRSTMRKLGIMEVAAISDDERFC